LGTSDDELIALVCDGRRTGIDVGLTLAELAALMADLGARQAINLDGGGSTALIHQGHLLNGPSTVRPQRSRSDHTQRTGLAGPGDDRRSSPESRAICPISENRVVLLL